MLHDSFYYEGECLINCTDDIINIILARMEKYKLNDFIQLHKNTLVVKNNISNQYTRLELLLDLLIFIQKNGEIELEKPFILKRQTEKESNIIYQIFKFKKTLHFYKLNNDTGTEEVTPLYLEFMKRKNNSPFNFIYISTAFLNKNETRRLTVGNYEIPLFEPFMKRRLDTKRKLYIGQDNDLILPNGEIKSACFACKNRLLQTTKKGCESCIPTILNDNNAKKP